MATCKYCGVSQLHWASSYNGMKTLYYLVDGESNEHYCKWKHIKHLPPNERPYNWRPNKPTTK